MKLLEHLHASGRLPDLMDDTLGARETARLRSHVHSCDRCARKLHRLERSEALLSRMPRMLLPLEPAAAGGPEARLVTLAQWGGARPKRQGYGSLPAASAAAVVAVIFALSITAPEWGSVMVGDMGASTTVASVMPDSSFYPMTLR